VGQFVAGRKARYCSLAEHKIRGEHVTRQHPEHLSQQRQRSHNAAGGFQRATKVPALVRVLQAQTLGML